MDGDIFFHRFFDEPKVLKMASSPERCNVSNPRNFFFFLSDGFVFMRILPDILTVVLCAQLSSLLPFLES